LEVLIRTMLFRTDKVDFLKDLTPRPPLHFMERGEDRRCIRIGGEVKIVTVLLFG
jgi:hypothetical protein